MLNVRLYRTAWLVAGVALVVALLTLQSPDPGPEPALPSTLDGQGTLQLDQQLLARAPERAAGSGPDQQAARFVQGQLQQVPGAAGAGRRRNRVQVQDFQAVRDGEPVLLRNVYLVVPGVPDGRVPGGIVVVAPRDTPAGVAAGTSATAVMLRLARASGTTRHQRPHLFVSTDGSTIGNAGLRWFLERFSAFPLSAVVVLDAPGETSGDRVHVWTAGATDRQALGLGNIAERSVERAGGRPEGPPSLNGQLLRLAVPQTFGEQGAAIAAGLPAITLSGRAESPLTEGAPATAERLELVANAANDLLTTLDAVTAIPAADGTLRFSGRFLRPTVARLALLLAMLPVLVVVVDLVARRRRARAPLGDGLRAVGRRVVPLAAALGAAHILALGGLLPRTAAGRPPLPVDARVGPVEGLALALVAAAGVLGWRATRRSARRLSVLPAVEGTAALAALAVLLVALWLVSPYAVVLAVPAAHAAVLSLEARRPWQLAGLGVLALAPLIALTVHISGILDAGIPFSAWYLSATAANGSRGATGLLLGLLSAGCIWSICAAAVDRATTEGPGGRRAPRRRPTRSPRRGR